MFKKYFSISDELQVGIDPNAFGVQVVVAAIKTKKVITNFSLQKENVSQENLKEFLLELRKKIPKTCRKVVLGVDPQKTMLREFSTHADLTDREIIKMISYHSHEWFGKELHGLYYDFESLDRSIAQKNQRLIRVYVAHQGLLKEWVSACQHSEFKISAMPLKIMALTVLYDLFHRSEVENIGAVVYVDQCLILMIRQGQKIIYIKNEEVVLAQGNEQNPDLYYSVFCRAWQLYLACGLPSATSILILGSQPLTLNLAVLIKKNQNMIVIADQYLATHHELPRQFDCAYGLALWNAKPCV